jgi:2-iminobutanoate/2-iminopropanoate deaminase
VKPPAWLKRVEDCAAFSAAYANVFGSHKPARSTTICDLAVAEALVEIEALAVV